MYLRFKFYNFASTVNDIFFIEIIMNWEIHWELKLYHYNLVSAISTWAGYVKHIDKLIQVLLKIPLN